MVLAAMSEGRTTEASGPVLGVYEADASRGTAIAVPLEAAGYRVRRYGTAAEAVAALRGNEPPELLVLASEPQGSPPSPTRELCVVARQRNLPTLEVCDETYDLDALVGRDGELEVDDWVSWANLAVELPVRVGRLLRRRGDGGRSASASRSALRAAAQHFPLIIHDLRTPLNVVGLSLRMIDQAVPRDNAELLEDLRYVEENFKQIERMLALMSDYCRLLEVEGAGEAAAFSPESLIGDVVELRSLKSGAAAIPVHVEIRPTCPSEVRLDPIGTRLALQYALVNAVAAAGPSAKPSGVAVTLHGGPDRWITEFQVAAPPPSSVRAVQLHSDQFGRLCGNAAERVGMELAIVARVSELLGGAARLDVDPTRGTTLVLDWPARAETR